MHNFHIRLHKYKIEWRSKRKSQEMVLFCWYKLVVHQCDTIVNQRHTKVKYSTRTLWHIVRQSKNAYLSALMETVVNGTVKGDASWDIHSISSMKKLVEYLFLRTMIHCFISLHLSLKKKWVCSFTHRPYKRISSC